MSPLVIDFETRSALDLKKVGIYRYVEDSSTRILCFHANFAGNSGTFFEFDFWTLPEWLSDALCNSDVPINAHNATVERLIIQKICTPKYDWPNVDNGRFHCSATRCSRLALPRALDKVGAALHLETQKDKEGVKIMRRLCKENGKPINPDDLARLGVYCKRDVDTEIAVEAHTFPMPKSEERLYQLTERINDRGVKVDTDLVRRLQARVQARIVELDEQISELTDSRVPKVSVVEKLKAWIYTETGTKVVALRKEFMRDLFNPENVLGYTFPEYVKDVIRLRQEGGKAASAAKLTSILNRMSGDGCVHGAFVHHGASTGRYTSMGVQLQNLKRETLKNFDKDIQRLDEFDLNEVSMCLRSCFVARAGCVFVDADYNAVEARGVGWLADCKKLLKIYREKGDPYCEMATVIFGRKITKEDVYERFVGKQVVLGAGYGLGSKKFEAMCAHFGQPISPSIAEKAIEAYRSEFWEIPKLWRSMERAAVEAIESPGEVTLAAKGKIEFKFTRGYLQMRLPSGRRLFYKNPQVEEVDKWGSGKLSPQISFMSVNRVTRQWTRETTWGGTLTENAVQALARDLLFDAMETIEYDYDIPIVLSVHDQIVAEVLKEDGEWAKAKVQYVMENPRPWATGFPVTAEPKITERFGK